MKKKIIIIGATSGIGKEMALMLAKQGHVVAITGRRNNLLEEIKQGHTSIITSCFDVADDQYEKYFTELVTQLGGLDLFIYNAGYGEVSQTLNWDIEKRTVKTNVVGFMNWTFQAYQYFLEQGFGQIALTSSIAAFRGNSWAPAYSASKSFMSNYAEGLQIKLKKLKKDIYITDIKPGFIRTKMAQGNGQFWVAEPQKAAAQILDAIERKKRVAYITRRWWIIAQLVRVLPYSIYRRLG